MNETPVAELDAVAEPDAGAGPDALAEPRAVAGPDAGTASPAVRLTAYIDYQCPYSDRAIRWLDALDPDRSSVVYRLFALEQVNVDPTAAGWRLWEQPLDYPHYRGRQDRRTLPAFIVTKLLEGAESPEVLARVRRGILDARFRSGADVSDIAVLAGLAVAAGADGERLQLRLDDPAAISSARAAIAGDWADARARYAIFGVPTIDLGEGAPVYVRLARDLDPEEGRAFFERFVELRRRAPFLLELKVPEEASGPGG